MNKKVSYICLGLCLALSVEGFAAPRGAARSRNSGGGKSRVVSNSLVSGYIDKYFKNTTITLVEKRSVALEPLMFPDAVSKITKTLSSDGKTTYPAQYGLCVPCSEIILEGEVPDANGVYKFEAHQYTDGTSCYELKPNGRNYRLTTKSGASDKGKCGEKIRMTIVDKRSDAYPEIDSAILRIVPNSSAYDYASIGMDEDTEIYDLIANYNKAKNDAIAECGKGRDTLKSIKGWLIAATATSGVAAVTGAADTVVRSIDTAGSKKAAAETPASTPNNGETNRAQDTAQQNAEGSENANAENGANQENGAVAQNQGNGAANKETATTEKSGEPNQLSGMKKAEIVLSSVSGVGNLGTMVSASVSADKVLDAINDLKACKAAATRMHNAGVALENELKEITSLDD